jgi:hypothetical protein
MEGTAIRSFGTSIRALEWLAEALRAILPSLGMKMSLLRHVSIFDFLFTTTTAPRQEVKHAIR